MKKIALALLLLVPGAAHAATSDGTCPLDAPNPVASIAAALPQGADVDAQRVNVAKAAAALVRDGQVVGLGTGRTAAKVVQAIADRVHAEGLHLTFTSTSVATEELARSLGLTVLSPDQAGPIDIAIDGADEVDPALDLVKGLGGALVRERLVERNAKRLVIVVDSEKPVAVLGSGKVPVEIVPFGAPETMRRLAALGATPVLRTGADGKTFVTDNGNWIADLTFDPKVVQGLSNATGKTRLANAIKLLPGVVDHGFFLGMAGDVFIGNADGSVTHLERKPSS